MTREINPSKEQEKHRIPSVGEKRKSPPDFAAGKKKSGRLESTQEKDSESGAGQSGEKQNARRSKKKKVDDNIEYESHSDISQFDILRGKTIRATDEFTKSHYKEMASKRSYDALKNATSNNYLHDASYPHSGVILPSSFHEGTSTMDLPMRPAHFQQHFDNFSAPPYRLNHQGEAAMSNNYPHDASYQYSGVNLPSSSYEGTSTMDLPMHPVQTFQQHLDNFSAPPYRLNHQGEAAMSNNYPHDASYPHFGVNLPGSFYEGTSTMDLPIRPDDIFNQHLDNTSVHPTLERNQLPDTYLNNFRTAYQEVSAKYGELRKRMSAEQIEKTTGFSHDDHKSILELVGSKYSKYYNNSEDNELIKNFVNILNKGISDSHKRLKQLNLLESKEFDRCLDGFRTAYQEVSAKYGELRKKMSAEQIKKYNWIFSR